jgi:hypothetical protein
MDDDYSCEKVSRTFFCLTRSVGDENDQLIIVRHRRSTATAEFDLFFRVPQAPASSPFSHLFCWLKAFQARSQVFATSKLSWSMTRRVIIEVKPRPLSEFNLLNDQKDL